MQEKAQPVLTRTHFSRLAAVWRSAGWPSHDALELDLLAQGLLTRHVDPFGRERVTVSDSGIDALSARRKENCRRLDSHETLCRHTAEWVASLGRIAFLQSSFRAKVDGRWRLGRPDIVSIRRTTHEAALSPIAYEVKVNRSDLLGDLAKPGKCAAYAEISSQTYYVIREGIATPEEIPVEYGVILAGTGGFTIARQARGRTVVWHHRHWMSLLLAQRIVAHPDTGQLPLCDTLPNDLPSPLRHSLRVAQPGAHE